MPLPVCCKGRAWPLTAPHGAWPAAQMQMSTPCSCSCTDTARGAGCWAGGPATLPWGTIPIPSLARRAAASSRGEQQCIQSVQGGNFLDRSYSLLPECQMYFPGLFVSCLWAQEAFGLGNSPKQFFQKRPCCLWCQWPKGCQCPGRGVMDGEWGNLSSAETNEVEVQKGLHLD